MRNRYIEQAADYEGTPVAIATHYDQYDEYHVIIKMQDDATYYLDWIGGEYAPEPDEFDELPFENLHWQKI
jgi:hypothetical protein